MDRPYRTSGETHTCPDCRTSVWLYEGLKVDGNWGVLEPHFPCPWCGSRKTPVHPSDARGRLQPVLPIFASKHRCVVNRNTRENFEVRNICLSRRFRTDDLLVNAHPRLAGLS